MSGNARKSQKLLEGSVLLESSFLTVSRPLSSLSLHKSVEKFRTTVWILFPGCCFCFFCIFLPFLFVFSVWRRLFIPKTPVRAASRLLYRNCIRFYFFFGVLFCGFFTIFRYITLIFFIHGKLCCISFWYSFPSISLPTFRCLRHICHTLVAAVSLTIFLFLFLLSSLPWNAKKILPFHSTISNGS